MSNLNSINDLEVVTINHIKHAIYSRGDNINNPVILFLHGGPGEPEMPYCYTYQRIWEKYFTIVHWDQRNCGKSLFLNNPEEVEKENDYAHLVEDANELINYLTIKFKKEKISVIGFSGGSILGILLIQKYPDKIERYIGIAQSVDDIESNKRAYKALEKKIEASNNISDLEDLKKNSNIIEYGGIEGLMYLRSLQRKYNMAENVENAMKRFKLSPYYTEKEKTYYDEYYENYHNYILEEATNFNVLKFPLTYQIPMFFISGKDDWMTPISLVDEFEKKISAPKKALYSIENTGHRVQDEKSEEIIEILVNKIFT